MSAAQGGGLQQLFAVSVEPRLASGAAKENDAVTFRELRLLICFARLWRRYLAAGVGFDL
jgi:hypothetical protein